MWHYCYIWFMYCANLGLDLNLRYHWPFSVPMKLVMTGRSGLVATVVFFSLLACLPSCQAELIELAERVPP